MRALQQSSADDRAGLEERYKKRLLEMDARLKEVRVVWRAAPSLPVACSRATAARVPVSSHSAKLNQGFDCNLAN